MSESHTTAAPASAPTPQISIQNNLAISTDYYAHGIATCVVDCFSVSLLNALKFWFLFLVPILSIVLLPLLVLITEPLPRWTVALGVISILAYECSFLLTFMVIFGPRLFFLHRLAISLGIVRFRRTRNHWANLSPRQQRKRIKNHKFTIFIHGTDAKRPVQKRTECTLFFNSFSLTDRPWLGVRIGTTMLTLGLQLWRDGLLPSDFFETVSAQTRSSGFIMRRIGWGDTIGQHYLGNLSRITLSVPLLGGANGEPDSAEASSSSRDRGKAKRFHDAIAAENEPDSDDGGRPQKRKKKRKVASTSKNKTGEPDGPNQGSESEGDSYVEEDEEESDSDVELIVENSELAEGLPSKTDPAARGNRKGKGKEKEKLARPKRKKQKVGNETQRGDEPIREPSDGPNAAKKAKLQPRRKPNAIWYFFQEMRREAGTVSRTNSYICNLGKRAVIEVTSSSNGNLTIKFPGALAYVSGVERKG
ncbi:hypothetical protein C8J57DRAFT_1222570 [Mycena rebaudengoi]|nr:hypothetical protein C8J57DRAFT_1222570 [Mycena rebaudengoi]